MERKDYSSKTTYCLALFDGFLLAYFPPSCFMRSQLGSQGGGNNNLQRRHIALHSLMVFYSLIFPLHVSWDPRWDRRGEKILIYKDDILFFLSDGFLLADLFSPCMFHEVQDGITGWVKIIIAVYLACNCYLNWLHTIFCIEEERYYIS